MKKGTRVKIICNGFTCSCHDVKAEELDAINYKRGFAPSNGNFGVFLNKSGIHNLIRDEKTGYEYVIWNSGFEEIKPLKIGEEVRVIPQLFGWGDIKAGDKGIIVEISDDVYTVMLKNRKKWNAYVDELEPIKNSNKEKTKMKYKLLKEFSGEILYKYNPCNSEFKKYINKYGFYDFPQFNQEFIDYAEKQKGWIKFLIDNKFIEKIKKPAVFYKVGQVFKIGIINPDFYILNRGQENFGKVFLASIKGGIWNSGAFVRNIQNISEEEFEKICNSERNIELVKVDIKELINNAVK